MTACTKEEATNKQRKNKIANHIHNVQFINNQRVGDTVVGTDKKQPITRKGSKERRYSQ